MKKLWIILILLQFSVACGSKKRSSTDCKKCSDFATQEEAKRYAKKHKKCKNSLDHDGDGRYCEDLPRR